MKKRPKDEAQLKRGLRITCLSLVKERVFVNGFLEDSLSHRIPLSGVQ